MATPTFVATGAIEESISAISVSWPAGHQVDDLGILLIETSGNGTTPTPSGWTHFSFSPTYDFTTTAGSKLSILYKVATSSAESNVFIADTGDHTLGSISVFRNTTPFIDDRWASDKTTASTTATIPSITTTVDGCMVIMACSRPNSDASTTHFGLGVNANLVSVSEAVQAGTTQGNGGGYTLQYGIKATAGVVGTTAISKTDSTTDAYYIAALVATADPLPDAYIDVPGPLGAPALMAAQTVSGIASSPTMLGAPLLLGYSLDSLILVPGPLSAPSLMVFNDFSTAPDMLRSIDYYACDIVDGASTYRVKISSWQATLQLDASNYLQAVIPACDQYMDMLTGLSVDAEFVIIKGAFLSDGSTVENELARATVSLRFDQGPQRHTCTMSGYSDAFTLPGAPTTATDRMLRYVRSSSTDTGGRRFRCAIDWFLQPGRTAIYGEQTMTVSYINYYVTMDGQGDAYMDVGERI